MGDSRRGWLIGRVVLLGARVWGTLMSQRVLYPPPQAVPLLPHGRRHFCAVGACGVVQPRSSFAWAEEVGGATQKPSFSERGGTALAVGDSRRVQLIGRVVLLGASVKGTLMR